MKLTREQAECPYCHGIDTKAIYKTAFDFEFYIYPDGSIAVHYTDDGLPAVMYSDPRIINYCPVCGRLLEEDK